MKNVILLVLCAIMSGCVSPYHHSGSGDSAKVRIVIDSDNYMLTSVAHLGGMCKERKGLGIIGAELMWLKKGAGEVSALNMLGGKASRDSKRIERHVTANKKLTVSFHLVGSLPSLGVVNCDMALSFTPDINTEYELAHNIHSGKCFVSVNRLSVNSLGELQRNKVNDVHHEDRVMCF